MSDSVFNPETFLGQTTEDAGSVNYFPVPQGEYLAQVDRVIGRRIHSDRTGQDYTILEITWAILDEEVKQITQQDKPQARQSVFLDMTPGGGLDFGRNRNVPLSRLRDAVGQNRNGKAWAPSHLVGQMAKVRVDHDINAETQEPRAVVSRIAKAQELFWTIASYWGVATIFFFGGYILGRGFRRFDEDPRSRKEYWDDHQHPRHDDPKHGD